MTILDTIIAAKRIEVEQRKRLTSTTALEGSSFFVRSVLSFRQFILDPERTGIIAEFKRRSPSKGVINDSASVEAVTADYTRFGASALSVLTDEMFFGGSTIDLQKARVNNIPILRKDFIVDEYQVLEAKSMGADVILLIAACLTKEEVKRLSAFAHSLSMEVLLELHDDTELDHICEYTEIVGVNNRNLKTFEVDKEKSIQLAEYIGKERIRIAESGISSPEDIISFRSYGFDGFLIGERFMKENDPGLAFRSFVDTLKSIA